MLHNQNLEVNGVTRNLTFGNIKQKKFFFFLLSKSPSFCLHRQNGNILYDYIACLAAPSCLVFFFYQKWCSSIHPSYPRQTGSHGPNLRRNYCFQPHLLFNNWELLKASNTFSIFTNLTTLTTYIKNMHEQKH